MPEGDVLYIAAQQLGAVLTGQIITRFESPLPELKDQAVEVTPVTGVRSQGNT